MKGACGFEHSNVLGGGLRAPGAPLAERSAVNRQVLGSIPSGGVTFLNFFFFGKTFEKKNMRSSGLEPES